MIICSCAVISNHDIELALLDILNEPQAPIPTPGVVFRHLQKKMGCCGCAPLAVETIYAKVEALEQKGLVCPYRSLSTRESLLRLAKGQIKRDEAGAKVTLSRESCDT
jgi:hypothetical protein